MGLVSVGVEPPPTPALDPIAVSLDGSPDLNESVSVQQLVSSVKLLLVNLSSSVEATNSVIRHDLTNATSLGGGVGIVPVHFGLSGFSTSLSSSDLARAHQYRLTDFYAVIAQLLLGLCLNSVMLCSVLVSMRQVRANASSSIVHRVHYCHSATYSHVPVVDLVLAVASSIAILRLLVRSALQIACFYGASLCFAYSSSLCYMHGFVNTFLHYLYLWNMAIFIQDRYIAHFHQHSYISKCSHFVLYVTLTGVAFLTWMHACAPIYGFSSYRFVVEELTCTIDWLSRFSCPYWVYSFLLVSGPAYVPILYWTLRLTLKRLAALSIFSPSKSSNESDLHLATSHSAAHLPSIEIHQVTTTTTTTSTANSASKTLSSLLHTKPAHVLLPCCFGASKLQTQTTVMPSSVSNTPSANSFEMHNTSATTPSSVNNNNNASHGQRNSLSSDSSNGNCSSSVKSAVPKCVAPKRYFRKRSSAASGIISTTNGGNNARNKATYQRASSSTGSDRTVYFSPSMLGSGSGSVSSSIAHLTKSHVLTASNELKSVTLCSWIFFLSFTPKLLHNACKACSESSPYPEITDADPNPAPILTTTPISASDLRTTFYLAYLDETAVTIIIPFVMLAFHSKLRFSLIMLIACLLTTCRVPFGHLKFRGVMSSRTSLRNRSARGSNKSRKGAGGRHHRSSSTSHKHFRPSLSSRSNAKSKSITIANCKSIKLSSSSDHNTFAAGPSSLGDTNTLATTLNRSSSLRINYSTSGHTSSVTAHDTHLHYQSDRNIAVTVI